MADDCWCRCLLVVCWWLCVAECVVFVVCCLLLIGCVVSWWLFDVGGLWFAVRCGFVLFVCCCCLFLVLCLMFDVGCGM